MKVSQEEKTDKVFDMVAAVCYSSFDGVQRPPEGILRDKFLTGDVFFAACDDIFAGFAIVIQRLDHPYLWTIAVAEDYRGYGVGRRLLNEITEDNRDAGYIELVCKVDNPAQRLYFDAGYRVVRVDRSFYGAEGPGLVMRREV